MAEVPPGPNALSSSPTEIISFPGGGCTLLGNNEDRGDFIVTGTGQQQANDGKGIIKTNQKNLHPNSSASQLHSTQTQQVNGIISCPEAVQNHVQHPTHKASDSRNAVLEHTDSTGEIHTELAGNRNLSKDSSCSHQNHSLSKNNGVIYTATMAITESERMSKKSEKNRTEALPSDPVDHVSTTWIEDNEGPGTQGARVEESAAVSTADVTSQAPVEEMANLSLERETEDSSIKYVRYESELQMPDIIRLITKDLSEPYSIYTYRYFIHNWPQLCFLAMVDNDCVGAIVCKLDMHKKMFRRGYIAMLAVDSKFRRKGIGTNLVKKAIYAMVDGDCDEVVLETEITNKSALKLYENLGFVRDKRLFRYYLNGVDALRLKLWLR
ncbi:N-alpha-acetyltransferase 30 [Chanos chanos]|uniref:N-alpha-acetyltransferase 30 n=1 Tax=Chanos chanos TaxID=29144 RepID=A0A6J2WG88_CHACN|nr:N-alpha-acetyltransferase 30 [Chanos chanos]